MFLYRIQERKKKFFFSYEYSKLILLLIFEPGLIDIVYFKYTVSFSSYI